MPGHSGSARPFLMSVIPNLLCRAITGSIAGPGEEKYRVPRRGRPRLGRWSVPFFRSRDRLLHQHRFRSLGKLVVGNLDWIADVHNIGN